MRHLALLFGLLVALHSSAFAADTPVAKRPPWTSSKLRGTPEPPEPYRVTSAFPQLHFKRPTSLEELPGSDRLVVTEIGGKIFSFMKDADAKQADLVIDLAAGAPGSKPQRVGLFDLEFHPRFAENRQLFVCYSHPADGGQVRVSRLTLDDATPPRAAAESEQVLIAWPAGGHSGGCLEFGPDGYLYISTGDGAGPNPPDGLTTGQNITDLLGSILRIDVDHRTGALPYAVPSDNPFVKLEGARPEIWGYGLRNPWKFGIDRQSGQLFVADNGWETWEMVHRVERGGNCGWPIMEGRAALRTEVKLGPTPIIPPVMDHPHTEANSVIGGPVYRGSKLPKLAGAFVYGDYITGTIWAIQPDKDRSYSHATLLDTDLRIVAFCEASRGELYVLDHDFTGQIYELLPNDAPDLSASFPRRLSRTGLFADLKTLTPAPGVVPYDVVAKRWMDGAQAERWVAVPDDGQIRLAKQTDDDATYPEGTVFIKHLNLPQGDSSRPIRLETQLLHFEQGVWRPYSYMWNEQGDEATLVDSIGTSRPLRVRSASSAEPIERTWHVNAVNECKLCHNAGPKFVLGFNAPQLGGAMLADRSSSETMLERLQQQGVLASVPALAADDPRRLVDPHDPQQPVEARARSYLHANCAMCHHPGGNAIVSFFLRRDLPFDKLNTNKGTGIGTFGLNDARIISPGDPFRSILLYRMSKLGYARMPYIGSRVVDSRGVALVEQWIRSMPATLSADQPAELKTNIEGPGLLKTGERPAAETLQRLTASTGSSLALAVAIHRGDLPEPVARKAVVAGVAAKSDIRGLFETFVPEAQRKVTLGATFDPQLILARSGDAERGKLIFYSDGARCRNCHEHDDREKSLGPTLAEIRKKYPRNEELLQHVLNPSLKIDEPFAAYTVHTTGGQVISGLIIEQNERVVAIKTTERKVVRLARDEIEDLQRSDKSLMPERILGDLTAQEAADLFEYLRTGAGK